MPNRYRMLPKLLIAATVGVAAGAGGAGLPQRAAPARPGRQARGATQPSRPSPSPLEALHFRNLGPAIAGGRVTAVAGVADNPNLYYVGTAAGGIFRTTDAGVSWTGLFQHQATSSVGAMALAPSDPSLVWVGTGEANLRSDIVTGHGVYFSPDSGNDWRYMGLGDAGQISSIAVSPLDPKVVYVGALGSAWGPSSQRGVFRTTDGGKTWKQVLFVNDTTGVSDLVMEPGNPEVLYAGMWQAVRKPWALQSDGPESGIYRSTDGGDSWQKLTAGLPAEPMGRIGLAVAPSEPARVYALVGSQQGVLWESGDRGGHWSLVNRSRNLDARPFYFSHLVVAPNDPETLFFLSFDLLKSADGGRSAAVITRGLHSDQHCLWIDPRNPQRMIEGNDGGAYLSTDGARTWRHFDDIPIEQFYSVSIDSGRVPYGLCGGLQDNGSWCGPSDSLSRGPITGAEWTSVGSGDGQYAVPGRGTPFIYADSQNGAVLRLDRETNELADLEPYLPGVGDYPVAELQYRFNWTAPIAVSPRDGRDVYVGGNVLFRSTDAGLEWKAISPDLTRDVKSKQQLSGGPGLLDLSGTETYDTILSIAISPRDPQVIWVGTDDGLIQVTRDGGKHWTNVAAHIPGLPPWGRISQIDGSPFDDASAYAAVDFHQTGDNRPYVFHTDDYGKTWKNIAGNLPADAPAHVVREDPNRRGLLVVGTDTGLFYSLDGNSWQAIECGFPTTPVYDLRFVKSAHDLVVATHGRGAFVLDDLSPLEQAGATAPAGVKLFAPLAATLWARFSRHGFQLVSFATPNPPFGAAIDYYLAPRRGSAGMAPVEISITGANGQPVRSLVGPGGAGYHHVYWDLRYDPPQPIFGEVSAADPFGALSGPPVVPGEYRVTLQGEGATESASLEVRPDPRSHAARAAFQAQAHAALAARDLLSSVNELTNRIEAVRQQLETLEYILLAHPENTAYQNLFAEARQLESKLDRIESPIYNRAAAGDSKAYLHYLSTLDARADHLLATLEIGYAQRPTGAMTDEMARVSGDATTRAGEFDAFVKQDVAAFNRDAAAAGVSQLFVPAAP